MIVYVSFHLRLRQISLLSDRIYRCLFSGSFSSILTLPLDLLSTENLVSDGFYGCCVVTCTLCAFISLVWLREQILRGGGPEWLDPQQQQEQNAQAAEAAAAAADVPPPVIVDNNNINNNNNGEQAAEEAEGLLDQVDLDDEQVLDDADDPVENPDEPGDNNALVNPQDDINWNPVEWDRAADELTWERVSSNQ